MNDERAFAIALAVTLGGSALVVAALWRPLRHVLVDLCGNESRAGFWSTFSNVVLVLVPLAAVMLGRRDDTTTSTLFAVVDHTKWSLLGLIVAVLCIALGVIAFIQPRRATVEVTSSQLDDLQRLLDKVEEIRARQILQRAPNEPARGIG